ncbi:hypothetical protein jhhlp_001628 [Lomentospora prolificans]|uniref:Uncharacterized protein n=1 Tax=Lomentospora prolificans TaxID=41688 RepID=A0A2N3NIT1_9PEZI|nr:hypothetical protein jhhlp_001628 [Lomentospora prolificans]
MPQDMPPTGGYGPVQYKVSEQFRGCLPRVRCRGTQLGAANVFIEDPIAEIRCGGPGKNGIGVFARKSWEGNGSELGGREMAGQYLLDGGVRNLPFRGFRPRTYLLGIGVVMGYGWYQLVKGIREAK